MIAIIDYGVGNLFSLKSSLAEIGAEAVVTSDEKVIADCDRIILPGVGAFEDAARKLRESGMADVVKKEAAAGKPLLGICLGMQLLLSESEEGAVDGNIKGLGLIPGTVKKFPSDKTVDQGLKVPQMGWNKLTDVKGSLLRDGDYVYFVHSFYCDPEEKEDAAAYTEYGIKYACALEHGNIFATQFHPEKSGEAGLQILERFARRIKK